MTTMQAQETPARPDHLLRQLSYADYVTILAVLLIVNALWLAWLGHLLVATGLAFGSMFLDYVDGALARRYGGSPYGHVLDSLYDVLGWVLFPGLAINSLLHWAWWSVLVTSVFCVFGVIRLARFTVAGYVKTSETYYTGLPVLFSKYALLLAFVPMLGWLAVVFLAGMVPLMVSSRLIRKPHPIFAQLELVYAAIFFWLATAHG